MKLNLSNPITWNWPRKEWRYVIDLLKPYHSENGIVVDGFIDATFGYSENDSLNQMTIPYKEDWIGFWHHPPKISPWIDKNQYSPEAIINKESFKASLPNCKGIFTFSNYLSTYLRKHLDVPIESLIHPTRFSDVLFDFDAFKESKQIVQVGSWLRRLSYFYSVEADGYRKIHLMGPGVAHNLELELKYNPEYSINPESVEVVDYVDDTEYDALLSKSIVFVNLYDSSVNNTIIECLVRNTPILVNRIKPVVEYLGKDYPLYYNTASDIPDLVKDVTLIRDTSQYIQDHPIKKKLTAGYFVQSMLESDIINNVNNSSGRKLKSRKISSVK
jgi:hypothetical protein